MPFWLRFANCGDVVCWYPAFCQHIEILASVQLERSIWVLLGLDGSCPDAQLRILAVLHRSHIAIARQRVNPHIDFLAVARDRKVEWSF